jgi:hypothetical protein
VVVNGHVFPEVDRQNIDIHSRDHALLYRNTGKGTFEDISEQAGPAFQARHSARGLAIGDIDNDGTLEILANNQNEPPSLWKQSHRAAGHWLLLKLVGSRSNRSAIGARVAVTAGGRTQIDEVRSGGSYLSQNDLRLHFGLGSADARRFDFRSLAFGRKDGSEGRGGGPAQLPFAPPSGRASNNGRTDGNCWWMASPL